MITETKKITLSEFLNKQNNSDPFKGQKFRDLLYTFEERKICPSSQKETDLFKAMKIAIEREENLLELFLYWETLVHNHPSLFKKLGPEIEECFKLIVSKKTKDNEQQVISFINYCGDVRNTPLFVREALQKLLSSSDKKN